MATPLPKSALRPSEQLAITAAGCRGRISPHLHDVNRAQVVSHKALQWQTEYGVVSFGTKDLDWVKAYERNQRTHHAQGSLVDRLERMEPMDDE